MPTLDSVGISFSEPNEGVTVNSEEDGFTPLGGGDANDGEAASTSGAAELVRLCRTETTATPCEPAMGSTDQCSREDVLDGTLSLTSRSSEHDAADRVDLATRVAAATDCSGGAEVEETAVQQTQKGVALLDPDQCSAAEQPRQTLATGAVPYYGSRNAPSDAPTATKGRRLVRNDRLSRAMTSCSAGHAVAEAPDLSHLEDDVEYDLRDNDSSSASPAGVVPALKAAIADMVTGECRRGPPPFAASLKDALAHLDCVDVSDGPTPSIDSRHSPQDSVKPAQQELLEQQLALQDCATPPEDQPGAQLLKKQHGPRGVGALSGPETISRKVAVRPLGLTPLHPSQQCEVWPGSM